MHAETGSIQGQSARSGGTHCPGPTSSMDEAARPTGTHHGASRPNRAVDHSPPHSMPKPDAPRWASRWFSLTVRWWSG